MELIEKWKIERDRLDSRSVAGRWAEVRYIFDHNEIEPRAATRACYSIRDCGQKTRVRWGQQYRCERRIQNISRGVRYELIEKDSWEG
jgi:hypothetical protein